MQTCSVMIFSIVDGQKKTFRKTGTLETTGVSARLIYDDEGSRVCVKIADNAVEIERNGDYTLRLSLIEKQITKGAIGIGGSTGEVEIYTNALGYTISDTAISLRTEYVLNFPHDKQTTVLSLNARLLSTKEEI